jgi:plasmid stability protein
MASIMIDNIDELTLRKISDLAASKNRSLQTEIGDILRHAALSPDDRARSLRKIADELASMTPKGIEQTDSVDLLREDRER